MLWFFIAEIVLKGSLFIRNRSILVQLFSIKSSALHIAMASTVNIELYYNKENVKTSSLAAIASAVLMLDLNPSM